eukprot:gnl/MRDRNA2_/MRDRNA2_100548_c0_seq1.p1 gnl/MRDRNA2_/MRDRNA2_100548_c0~~gnl/MRDRNA2_/MRDRNA2_100548_c0_seq1.p1  ORF type:complete len:496 (+),score=90.94 gnl/MRDRNA2_/MRDRNA2_100548_c0_seq1:44-1531(+)
MTMGESSVVVVTPAPASLPKCFVCPITQGILCDPVMTVDGQTYERVAILEWFKRGRRTSPLTNLSLASRQLFPNSTLREALDEYLKIMPNLVRPESRQCNISKALADYESNKMAGFDDNQSYDDFLDCEERENQHRLQHELRRMAEQLHVATQGCTSQELKNCCGMACAQELRTVAATVQQRLVQLANGAAPPSDAPTTAPAQMCGAGTFFQGTIATGGEDALLRFLDVGSGSTRAQIEHGGAVTSAAFGPDKNHLATGCTDGRLRIIDRRIGCSETALEHSDAVSAVAWSPQGGMVACACEDQLSLVNPATGATVVLAQQSDVILALGWDPSGQMIAAGSEEKVYVLDATHGFTRRTWAHGDWVRAVEWNPSGQRIATGCDDKKLRMLNAMSGRVEFEVQHQGAVLAVAWSPDGTRVATGSKDKHLRVVDALSGRVEVVVPHGGTVRALAWSPCGHMIATGGWDNRLRIIDAASGKVTSVLHHGGCVTTIAWSS